MKPICIIALSAGLCDRRRGHGRSGADRDRGVGHRQVPGAAGLKPAKIDAKETAVLVMDFTKQTCTPERRKRCADQVPKVQKFVSEARAKGALIIYSVAVPNSVPADILPALTPAAGRAGAAAARARQVHQQRSRKDA